ncbi:HNH endonuclease [Calothrix sp. NIES-4071]|nr:HNH endonuclease [Calothrix sp. NIES-4071]BAZ58160.1 HNH endonuclease [Calothrix sp. NIES-4105]
MSSISEGLRAKIRTQANDQCGYCRSLQRYVLGILEIEHIIPKALGGNDDEENLWLACRLCNNYKAAQTHATDPLTNRKVRLYNPRKQNWSQHFEWTNDGSNIIGMIKLYSLYRLK